MSINTIINCPCGERITKLNNSEWVVKCKKCNRMYVRYFDGRDYKISVKEKE